MNRLDAFLPHARIIIFLLGVAGPLVLMGLRAERDDQMLGHALAAAVAAGCSLWIAPLGLRFVAIIASVAALVLQAIAVFGPERAWDAGTAPILWALQAVLAAALAYLIWWNQARLRL